MAEAGQAENTQTQTQAADAAGAGTGATADAGKTGTSQQQGAISQTQTQTQTESPKLKPADFFRQREEKREKKAQDRVAELEREVSELKAIKAKQAEAPVQFLDDPDRWAQDVLTKAEQRALEAMQQREAKTQYERSAGQAVDWLLTRSHIKEDTKLAEQVAEIVKERYQHIFAVDPAVAIEKGYLAVCEAKGIAPDIAAFKAQGNLNGTGGNATSGARPSPPAGGKRVFERGEAEKYIFTAKPGTPDYAKRLAEVEEAQREGRIR